MYKKIAICALCIATGFQALRAQNTTTVALDSGSHILFNQSTTVLTGGTALDGDGAILQLGYYSGANFTGTFTPLAGEGSLNTAIIPGSTAEPYNKLSIGDITAEGGADGTFFVPGLNFVVGTTSGNSLPSAGTQLAIRFFNGTTIAGSTFYNAVTDSLWIWPAPATPPAVLTMSLEDAGLQWLSIAQGGAAGTAFHTSLPTAIPEPSTLACLLLGGAGTLAFGARRRFKS
jgi:hypothetical protein